jgi:hypothetical protein
MIKAIQNIPTLGFVVIATILEVCGDAIIRTSIYNHTGIARAGIMVAGALLVFGYAFTLNLAPVEFRELVGLYITSLFIVWQIINFIAFRSAPTLPIILGGLFIVAGGMIITFWKPN